MSIEEFAPAKVNLTLHVTGRRPDGYHLLDSLVVFADVGDRVSVARAAETSLIVTGPRAAGVPTDDSNLVLGAAAAMAVGEVAITLEKHLPAASGIGGGSADAAATLRALARLCDVDLPGPAAVLRLGADVPVCLAGCPGRMAGIGEVLKPIAGLPALPAVLVNPGVEVPTAAVFQALEDHSNPLMPAIPTGFASAAAMSAWIAEQRNDLEKPAWRVAPAIAKVLDSLRELPGCLLARMSGSGATCFGLFPSTATAGDAAAAISRSQPDWWVVATSLS